MNLRRHLGLPWQLLRRARWTVILGCGLAAYFVYHGIEGSRGWYAHRELSRQLQAAEQELARLTEERRALVARIRGLSDRSLDPDLLDELARRRLSYAAPADVIILLEPADTRP